MLRTRLLLNLFLILVLIAGFFAYRMFSATELSTQNRLTQINPQSVTQIEISHNGSVPVVRMVQVDQHWRITMLEGFEADALSELKPNQWLIENLLALSRARYSEHYAETDIQQYGLLAPLATVTFDKVVIKFGDSVPLTSQRYVMVGDQVYVIDSEFLRYVITEPVEYVSHDLFDSNNDIIELRLPQYHLQRGEKGLWQLSPNPLNLSQDQINVFIDQWRYAHAMRTQPAKPEAGSKTITVIMRNGKTLLLELSQHNNITHITRRDIGISYVFPKDVSEHLLEPVAIEPAEPADARITRS